MGREDSIRKREVRARVTQNELAEITGLERSTVNAWLCGRYRRTPGRRVGRLEKAVELINAEPLESFIANKTSVLVRITREIASAG